MLILTAVQIEAKAVRRALGKSNHPVHVVGIGAKHLPSPDQMVGISHIILCGVAGGLDPSLKIGDVVIDESPQGRIHTAKKIIATPAEKAELFQKTGALAVDMEHGIVKSFADQYHLPLIGIRAISDTADQTLNPKVIQFVDDLGRPRPARIALGLIGQPSLIPYLLRLNANTKYALLQLTEALKKVLTQGTLR